MAGINCQARCVDPPAQAAGSSAGADGPAPSARLAQGRLQDWSTDTPGSPMFTETSVP